MKRKIYSKLLQWKNSKDRRPLIVKGARQIGKTYSITEFGLKEYGNVVICNLEKEIEIRKIFEAGNLDPKVIIPRISNQKGQTISPEHTLLILDEIQACPIALTALRYFYEDAKEYHVIASGSLLGVALNRVNNCSYPVGRVETINMYPLDFEEFIMAVKGEWADSTISSIRECFKNNEPYPLHESMMKLFKQYLFTGGFPEVVANWIENNNPELVKDKQFKLIDAYQNDMAKYNKISEIPKTKIVYDNLSIQLSKENRKFKYSGIKEGSRAKEFENAIEWICTSGIANRLYRLEQIKLPLRAYQSLTDFKFYFNDCGICCNYMHINLDDLLYDNPKIDQFKGGLVENYVFNELIKKDYECYYWTSKYDAEVDFITRIGLDIIPIEVKSSEHTKSKSLNEYIKRYKPSYSIRLSPKNFGFENNIKSVPLYALFCLEQNF